MENSEHMCLASDAMNASALVVAREDHPVADRDRLDDGVLFVEQRDLAVVEDQVRGIRNGDLLVHRLQARRARRHDDRSHPPDTDQELPPEQASHRPSLPSLPSG